MSSRCPPASRADIMPGCHLATRLVPHTESTRAGNVSNCNFASHPLDLPAKSTVLLTAASAGLTAPNVMPGVSLGRTCTGGGRQLLLSKRRAMTTQTADNRGSAQRPSRRQVAPEPTRAARQTVETPTAPGSNSNFTGLPKNGQDIPVTTPVTDPQMQACRSSCSSVPARADPTGQLCNIHRHHKAML